jgi:hypothetical protein
MICEIATTIVFALLLVVIGTQSDVNSTEAKSYLDKSQIIGVTSSSPGVDFATRQRINLEKLARSDFGPEVMK